MAMPHDYGWREKTVHWLLRSLLLFTGMIGGYFAAGPIYGIVAAFTIGAVYLLWPSVPSFLKWWNVRDQVRKSGKRERKTGKRVVVCGVSAMLAAQALMAIPILAWISLAYRWQTLGEDAAMFRPASFWASLWWAVGGLLLAALLLGLAVAFRPAVERVNSDGAPRYQGLQAHRLLSIWLSTVIQCEVLVLLLGLTGPAIALYFVLDAMTVGQASTAWNLFLFYPALPAGLLAVAGMLVAWRDIAIQEDGSAEEPVEAGPSREPPNVIGFGAPGLAAVAVGGYLAAVGSILYPLHLGIVALFASTPALVQDTATTSALAAWITEQRHAGRTDAAIVDAINRYGHWTANAPNKGLAELLPELETDPEGGVRGSDCSISVAAGPSDPTETEAIDWSKVPRWSVPSYGGGDNDNNLENTRERTSQEPFLSIRYCLKVTCTSPVAWQSPPAVSLGSSHPTVNPAWTYRYYFDFYADGVAPSPGGYCTRDGRLADRYQG